MSTSHGKQPRRLGAVAAAIGLAATAFAVGSAGVGNLSVVQATGGVASSIVTVEPARAADSRSATGLSGPVAANTSVKLDVTGAIPTRVGSDDVTATIVPDGATGVLLNVTAVRPDARGFVSIRPGDATGEPSSSNLNVQVGAAVPNAVTVALPTTGPDAGTIDIWYGSGTAGATTNLLVDIVGYTTAVTGGTGTPGPAGADGTNGMDGIDGIDGADGMDATTPDNVVWVAPSGGDYTLVSAAVAAATPNTLIKVAPGTYTETAPIVLPSDIVIEGSGRSATTITCACGGTDTAVASGANSSTMSASVIGGTEIRDLTIVNTGGGDVAVALRIDQASGLIIDTVSASASGAADAVGIALTLSAPRIDNVVAEATSTAAAGTNAIGLLIGDSSSPRVSRSSAVGTNAAIARGMLIQSGSDPAMDNMSVFAAGPGFNMGIDAQTGANFVLADTFVNVDPGLPTNVAITGLGTGFIADTTIIGLVDATNLTCINARDGLFAPLDGACDT